MPTNAPVIPQAQIVFVYLMVGLVVAGTILMIVFKLLTWLEERRDGVTYQWQPPAPREPSRIGAWITRQAEDAETRHAPRRIMPSAGDGGRANDGGTPLVYVPVSSMPYQAAGMDESNSAAPDMDGEKHDSFVRDATVNEWIVRMAVARGDDKKYRFSANQIHAAVGGDRNAVLAKIKEIRSGPPTPVFPPLTPEQQQNREALGLTKKESL